MASILWRAAKYFHYGSSQRIDFFFHLFFGSSFFFLAFSLSKGGGEILSILPMGGGEILDLVVDMFTIEMPWSISCLPCAVKLAFHVSISMGLGQKTPMMHIHPFP